MEFSKLPHEVKTIAARCLAEKMNIAPELSESHIRDQSAKNQGLQVRDAFIALFSEREMEGEKKAAAERIAATIAGMQQLIGSDKVLKTQVKHLISATDDLLDKCL
ncbi:hypothetical protein JYZ84_002342 [Salmonella enterica subsp. enterica serovar Sandiego]|nr:hypothetical protein [Salmonella enterica subsp. enterica serovar Sandiego]